MRLLAAAVVGAAVLFAVPFASRADDNQACSDGQGVTLVVDFQALPGGVNVRCASQPISNGYDVFHHTNPPVSYETVSGRDFVCRIAGVPENADCSNYPPADAYWSYWWAKPGEDWQYASKGAGAHHVPPGAYEGWSWVSSDHAYPPRYPVPPAPTTTTTTNDAVTTPAPSATPTTRARVADAPAVTTPSPTTTVLAGVAVATTTTTTTTVALGHVDLSRSAHHGGSRMGFVVSLLVIVVLAAIAGVVVWAR